MKQKTIDSIIDVEGGYVFDPDDSGGETDIAYAAFAGAGFWALCSDSLRLTTTSVVVDVSGDLDVSGSLYTDGVILGSTVDWSSTCRIGESTNDSVTLATTAEYVKIGSLVTIAVRFDNVDTTGLLPGGGIRLKNLPFTPSDNGTGLVRMSSVARDTAKFTPTLQLIVSTDHADIGQVSSTGFFNSMSWADVTDDTSDVYVTATYLTKEELE
jgi:hypothetical protein